MKNELPPDYSEIDHQQIDQEVVDNAPLLQQPQQPQLYQQFPQVTLVATNQPIPVRITDGMMHLTVLEPCRIFCLYCQSQQPTRIVEKATCCAYMSCITLSCFAPLLCWIPFCLKDFKNVYHECCNCGSKLAQISPA
jgi:LITAF-like zinc ribbon domain